MAKHGSWLLVLGTLIFAVGCGSSKKDPHDSDPDAGAPSDEGGAPTDPGRAGGGAATSGSGGTGAVQGGSLGVAGRMGATAGTAGTAGVVNQCPTMRCGGDVVGTWEIVDYCLGQVMGIESCPGLKGDASALKESGTITYNADLTYSSMDEISGTIELTYPLSCIGGLTCADLVKTLSNVQIGYDVQSCEEVADACACSVTVQQTNTETGTYEVSGNLLLQTRAGSAMTLSIDYCVDGDTLSVSSATSQSYTLERR